MTYCHACSRHTLINGACSDQCQHREAHRGNLCGPDLQRVRDDLDVIAAAMTCPPPAKGPGAGNGERSLPGGTELLDFRYSGELLACLESWCRVWHEDMTDDDTAPVYPARTVVHMCAWLRVNVETFGCQHEAVSEFAQELRDWGSRAKRITGDIPQGNVVPCECGRRLRVEAHDMDAEVTCRGCGNRWTTRSLIIRAGDDDAWLDTEAMTAWTGVPRSTLHRWASRGRVERRHGLFRVGSVREAARSA